MIQLYIYVYLIFLKLSSHLGCYIILSSNCYAMLVAQMVKNLPAKWETWVRSLDWEDLLEKEMATHSQYSCLENPMDRGDWQAI